ncbi:MAG: Crp/Fnr family transcriptional regulator [Deltaproteobacteria bacterium]|nr:Crp/Fnr family transcriptional regulator [Deltaproteobacteria bacterium]
MNRQAFLRGIDLFKSLTAEDANKLAALFKGIKLKRGEVLFHKGDKGTAFYVVRKGSIKIVLPSRMGDEVAPAIFSEGDFFGEMALLDGMPRSADAVSLEQTELLALKRKDFLLFLRKNEEAMDAILSYLSMRLRKTDDLLKDAHFLNISRRLARRLVELIKKHGCPMEDGEMIIDLDLNQSDLASMVGATRESINKELRILREKGIVSMRENKILILNMERLERRAYL